jgi:hypothetical protein
MTKWRCAYLEGMFAAEASVWRISNGVAREEGLTAAVCHHESGHTVLRHALGFNCGPTVVQTRFWREAESGILRAMTSGVSMAPRDGPLPDIVDIGTDFGALEIQRCFDADDDPLMHWRDFLPLRLSFAAAMRRRTIHGTKLFLGTALSY